MSDNAKSIQKVQMSQVRSPQTSFRTIASTSFLSKPGNILTVACLCSCRTICRASTCRLPVWKAFQVHHLDPRKPISSLHRIPQLAGSKRHLHGIQLPSNPRRCRRFTQNAPTMERECLRCTRRMQPCARSHRYHLGLGQTQVSTAVLLRPLGVRRHREKHSTTISSSSSTFIGQTVHQRRRPRRG